MGKKLSVIVPVYNKEKLLVKAHRQFFPAKTYEINFPMQHPVYVIDDFFTD